MKRFTLLFLVMTISIKAKPLEPYGNYLVVLVHGIHVNYETGNEQVCIPCQSDIDCEEIKQKTIDTLRMETGLFQENFGVSVARSIRHEIDSVPEIVFSDTVWNYDTIHDTTRVVCYRKTTYEEEKKASHLFDPGADPFGMDFGDLKKYLEEELGIRGHVYAYNFHDPAETYHTFDTSESAMSLARQLGDRDSSFSYETGDYKLFPTYRPNLDRSDNWFYQNMFKEEDRYL